MFINYKKYQHHLTNASLGGVKLVFRRFFKEVFQILKKFIVTPLVVVTIFLFSYNPKVSAETINFGGQRYELYQYMEAMHLWWEGIQMNYRDARARGYPQPNEHIVLGADLCYLVSVMFPWNYGTVFNYFIIVYDDHYYAYINEQIQAVPRGSFNEYLMKYILEKEYNAILAEEQKRREEEAKRRVEQEKTNKFNAFYSGGR